MLFPIAESAGQLHMRRTIMKCKVSSSNLRSWLIYLIIRIENEYHVMFKVKFIFTIVHSYQLQQTSSIHYNSLSSTEDIDDPANYPLGYHYTHFAISRKVNN